MTAETEERGPRSPPITRVVPNADDACVRGRLAGGGGRRWAHRPRTRI